METELQSINSKILSFPSPGSGIIVSFILNVMDEIVQREFLNKGKVVNFSQEEFYYYFVEAMKFSFSRRQEMADHKFIDMEKVRKIYHLCILELFCF